MIDHAYKYPSVSSTSASHSTIPYALAESFTMCHYTTTTFTCWHRRTCVTHCRYYATGVCNATCNIRRSSRDCGYPACRNARTHRDFDATTPETTEVGPLEGTEAELLAPGRLHCSRVRFAASFKVVRFSIDVRGKRMAHAVISHSHRAPLTCPTDERQDKAFRNT